MRDARVDEKALDEYRRQFEAHVAALWNGAVYRDGVWRSPAGELLAIDVLPENLLAWAVFRACQSQWDRPGGFSGKCGLPWTQVEAAMRLMGIPSTLRPDTFLRVRVLVEYGRERLIERMPAS